MNNHYLHPSQAIIPAEHSLVTTILGSCVAVCIYDKVEKKGGINHYMLPNKNNMGKVTHMYGDFSINFLIKKMMEKGSVKENLVAKLFGGSSSTSHHKSVGQQNIELAERVLSGHKIKIAAKNVGGRRARKIIFDTQSGLVKMKYLNYEPLT